MGRCPGQIPSWRSRVLIWWWHPHQFQPYTKPSSFRAANFYLSPGREDSFCASETCRRWQGWNFQIMDDYRIDVLKIVCKHRHGKKDFMDGVFCFFMNQGTILLSFGYLTLHDGIHQFIFIGKKLINCLLEIPIWEDNWSMVTALNPILR